MVQSLMYCSEQISIPETFPNILKTYAKAAIRTQPYDLLRWSATYFRCLAMNVHPPAKSRLEKDVRCGSLTKGYLKVLLDQVGKGYFICREILQKKWEGLCLPEEELLKYLSVCRMLNWPQVHWLKLFVVMVGSLNQTPSETINMLCELLTDDVEGGPARVPLWMFRVCYIFLSELDCSEEQSFINGCRKLPNGELEDTNVMESIPKVFGATFIQKAIIDECKKLSGVVSEEDLTSISELQSNQSLNPSEKSTLLFEGKYSDVNKIIENSEDFQSIILLLNEIRGVKRSESGGKGQVNDTSLEPSKQQDIESRMEQAKICEDNSRKYLQQDAVVMLRDLGPPWNYIHQFASTSRRDISYNFIEQESITSDLTPNPSSDGSLDLEKEMPAVVIDDSTDEQKSESSLNSVKGFISDERRSLAESFNANSLENIRNILENAETQGDINIADSASVITFLQKEENEGTKSDSLNIQVIIKLLNDAKDQNIAFSTLDDVVNYIEREYYNLKQSIGNDDVENTNEENLDENMQETENTEKNNKSAEDIESGNQGVVSANLKRAKSSSTEAENSKLEDILDIGDHPDNIKTVDTTPTISSNMILGLIKKSDSVLSNNDENNGSTTPTSFTENHNPIDSTSDEEMNKVLRSQTTVEEIDHIKSAAYICGLEEDDNISCNKSSPDFSCIIPAYPGIGPTVSKKTIEDCIAYLKFRSRSQKGMVMPRNFKEEKCPNMFD